MQRTLTLSEVSGDTPSELDLVSALGGLKFGMAPVQTGEELHFDEEMARLRDCLAEVET